MVKRNIILLAALVVIIVVFVAGAYTPIGVSYAKFLIDMTLRKLENILKSDFPHMVLGIFLNNAAICLLMFVPVAGAALGLLTIYFTGLVVSAMSIVSNKSREFILAHIFTSPHTWAEFVAYSLALSENIILTYVIIGKFLLNKKLSLSSELKNLAKNIAISLALLIAGAIIEALMILAQRT